MTIAPVSNNRAHIHGIQELSGEIDILCIDPGRSIIFVIEAKDPFMPMSARSIKGQTHAFHKPGGHVDKLLRKVNDIKISAESLADNKGVDQPGRDWQVVGIIVTKHVTPAAYSRTCKTTFCTADTLRQTIIYYKS